MEKFESALCGANLLWNHLIVRVACVLLRVCICIFLFSYVFCFGVAFQFCRTTKQSDNKGIQFNSSLLTPFQQWNMVVAASTSGHAFLHGRLSPQKSYIPFALLIPHLFTPVSLCTLPLIQLAVLHFWSDSNSIVLHGFVLWSVTRTLNLIKSNLNKNVNAPQSRSESYWESVALFEDCSPKTTADPNTLPALTAATTAILMQAAALFFTENNTFFLWMSTMQYLHYAGYLTAPFPSVLERTVDVRQNFHSHSPACSVLNNMYDPECFKSYIVNV